MSAVGISAAKIVSAEGFLHSPRETVCPTEVISSVMQLTLGFPGRDHPAVAYLRLVSIRRNACFAYLLTRVREGTARQRLRVSLAQSHLHFPSEVGSPLFLQHKRNRGHCERRSNHCERPHITLSARCGEKKGDSSLAILCGDLTDHVQMNLY